MVDKLKNLDIGSLSQGKIKLVTQAKEKFVVNVELILISKAADLLNKWLDRVINRWDSAKSPRGPKAVHNEPQEEVK